MAGLALPARRIRRVQARSHHDPPESRRIYGVSGHEMPHVRLSAFLPRNANSGADAQHGRIITCLGLGGKTLSPSAASPWPMLNLCVPSTCCVVSNIRPTVQTPAYCTNPQRCTTITQTNAAPSTQWKSKDMTKPLNQDEVLRVFSLVEKIHELFHQPDNYSLENFYKFGEENYSEIHEAYYKIIWNWLSEENQNKIIETQ